MKPIKQLLESVRSQAPVVGLTHGFYRYPARFSPQFARSVIEAFTQPMDTVMDPFMGGGTAAVEALGLGRRFVGSDLNSLSVFVTRIKTTPLSYRINHRYPLKPCVKIAIRLGASLSSSLPSLGRSITTQSTRSQEANCAFSARARLRSLAMRKRLSRG